MSTIAGRDTGRYKKLRAAHRAESERKQSPCWLCRQPIDYDAGPDDDNSYSLDHIEPLSKRPELAEVYSNFAAAHLRCNKGRNNREPQLDVGEPSEDW